MASIISRLKNELRERQVPFFDDEDFEYYLTKNNGDFGATAYEMLIVKSEESTLVVSGLSTTDTSKYFRRLASRHKQFNSGILGG